MQELATKNEFRDHISLLFHHNCLVKLAQEGAVIREHHVELPTVVTDEDDAVMLVKTTVANCQKLAEWIQRKYEVPNRKEVATQSPSLPLIITANSDEKLNYQFALEENNRLRAILLEATDANKRWQQCYAECQRYMQKLVDMVHELRDRNSPSPQPSDPINPRHEQAMEEQFAQTNRNSSNQDAVSTLEHLNEQLLVEMDQMHGELEQCKRRLSETTFVMDRSKQEHKEHIELLEMQLQGHRDDWEAESKEKSFLKNRNAQLLEELRVANARIQQLQYRSDDCTCYFHDGAHTDPEVHSHSRMAYNIPPDDQCILISRSPTPMKQPIMADSAHETENGSVVPTGSRVRSSSPVPAPQSPPSFTAVHPPNTFSCPACSQVFTQEKHVEFLEHFEKCCCFTTRAGKADNNKDSC